MWIRTFIRWVDTDRHVTSCECNNNSQGAIDVENNQGHVDWEVPTVG